MFKEDLSFHETDDAFLVTATGCDGSTSLCVFESHVFFRNEGRHVHELTFVPSANDSAADLAQIAFNQTRRLLSPAMPRLGNDRAHRGASEPATPAAAPRSSAQSPFHRLWLDKRFAEALWGIQDWTTSSRLREALALVTRYRADPAEAAFISKLLGRGDSAALSTEPYGFSV